MKRATIFTAVSVAALLSAGLPLAAQAQNLMAVEKIEPGQTNVTQTVRISLNKSMVIELENPAADVVITNPSIADASVQTAKRLIFRGVETGQTNAFVFDRDGNTLLNLEITVDIDTAYVEELIKKYVPSSRVAVESVSGSILVSGKVDSLSHSEQVMRLVRAFSGDDDVNIVNMLAIDAKDQVMLEVRIVEMQRSVIKQLGINLTGNTDFGDKANLTPQVLYEGNPPIDTGQTVLAPGLPFTNNFGINSSNNFNIAGAALGGLSTSLGYTNYNEDEFQSSLGAQIDALERIGIVRTLAEPNIMAVSGESAKFLAGGEFPVPVAQDEAGQISVEFKPYGVGLGFTPFVLSEGRISLRVSTEVSELSTQGAFQGESTTFTDANGDVVSIQGLTIPSLTVRRAESVVELPSGGSTMLAGLIQSSSRQTLDQLPGLKKLPILGALFQSRDFINEETEMVVIITPYLIDPTTKEKLSTPADGYVNASDPQTLFFGKLNAQYAHTGEGLSKENYNAPVGFMEE